MVVPGTSANGPTYCDVGNHGQVLFRGIGSIWSKVLWFCITNVFIMITLTWLSRAKKFGLGITSPAHALIALLVSIQLVSRIHGTMARRSKCHKGLATMYVGQYYDNILDVKTKLQKELC